MRQYLSNNGGNSLVFMTRSPWQTGLRNVRPWERYMEGWRHLGKVSSWLGSQGTFFSYWHPKLFLAVCKAQQPLSTFSKSPRLSRHSCPSTRHSPWSSASLAHCPGPQAQHPARPPCSLSPATLVPLTHCPQLNLTKMLQFITQVHSYPDGQAFRSMEPILVSYCGCNLLPQT